MDFLEYNDALCEQRGAMLAGKLRVTDTDVIFKYRKSGKTEKFAGADIEVLNWQRMSGDWALRIFLKSGDLHRFGGFKDSDQDKIAKFFKQNFDKELATKQLSLKGWNWGAAVFKGNTLSFDVDETTAFEFPLGYVSGCTPGKTEMTLEFHTIDEAAVNLMEMRFHLPATIDNPDPTEAFHDQVMKKASVVTATGDVLAIFRQVNCLTPRGRYDISIYPIFVNMHGKTYDFKVPISTIQRLFLLPHRDGRKTYFVLALDPPIKQGMTRYHFLILSFEVDEDDEMDLELPISEEELKTKYEGRIPKEIKGQSYEVMSKLTKGLAAKKLTVPGSFRGHSGTPAVACSYKAAAGYLYPLERGFMYIHKPPMYLRLDDVSNVNFARSGGGTRTFDFEVQIKNDLMHTFSSIDKEEYNNLFNFVKEKKIRIKSQGGMEKGANYASDDDGKSDPYLERMKREGEERDEDDSDEDESTDEDFNPDAAPGSGSDAAGGSDVAEEFDSNPDSTESEAGESDDSAKRAKRLKKKEKKEKREKKRASSAKEKPAKRKKKNDNGAPKRPMTAYFLWLNAHREQIKEEHPGIAITEISKKAGEMWRELKDKTEWEKKNVEAKANYEEQMKEWRAAGGEVPGRTPKAGKSSGGPKKSPKKSVSNVTGGGGAGFKSKEYIEDSSSSDEDKPSKTKPTKTKKVKTEKKESEEEEEEAESTPASSGDEKPSKTKPKPTKTKVKAEKKESEEEEEEAESTPASSGGSDESGDASD